MTSEISPPTNPHPNPQGTTDECSASMEVDESTSIKVDPSRKNGSNPNLTTSTSNISHGKPMLDSEMTDAALKVTKENKQDSITLGGTIDKQAFALLTGLYEVRSI